MTVWLNVTTSWKWAGPPVGIVRVEQDLCEAIARISAEPVRYCVFDRDTFIEVPATAMAIKPTVPDQPARPILRKIGRAKARAIAKSGRMAQRLRKVLNTLTAVMLRPAGSRAPTKHLSTRSAADIRPNDVVVTVGLDWLVDFQKFYVQIKDHQAHVIAFCHDLIPLRQPELCGPNYKQRIEPYFKTVFAQADVVLCNSQFTQTEVLKYSAEQGDAAPKTYVMPLGCNAAKANPASVLLPPLRANGYVLYVSTIERRKNHQLLYNLYAELADHPDFDRLPDLCFVGTVGWRVENLLDDIALNERVRDKIKFLTNVSDEGLARLYSDALFCVFPSLFEGWGLPVAEALSFGKAVIASDTPALIEASGGVACHISPYDGRAWRDTFLRMALDGDWRQAQESAVQAQFQPISWDSGAAAVLAIAQQLASAPK